jgi:ABC-type transport system substrate-binding protein
MLQYYEIYSVLLPAAKAMCRYTGSVFTCDLNSYFLDEKNIYQFLNLSIIHSYNIVFKHPVAVIYSSFKHYTSVHNATYLLSLSPSYDTFQLYMAIIRCFFAKTVSLCSMSNFSYHM